MNRVLIDFFRLPGTTGNYWNRLTPFIFSIFLAPEIVAGVHLRYQREVIRGRR